ncbi:pyridoxamine 5'-phosphate oxidase family protein [Candidatus Poribacteria bacterium]
MATFYEELDEKLQQFIAEQKIYFTATAPAEGRISLSPKGLNTFRCLDSRTVAYMNLTGSGNETAAHLLENGRITIMFCSFTEEPMILRIYGKGRSVYPQDADWDDLISQFDLMPGIRQIIVVDIDSVQTACGAGVPFYEFVGERDGLLRWFENSGEEEMEKYRQRANAVSIDGKPTGLPKEEK